MTCISAIETNQPSLIEKIDPSLYAVTEVKRLGHRRTSSHPITPQARKSILSSNNKMSRSFEKVKVISLRTWQSLPNLQQETSSSRPRSHTINERQQNWKLQKKVSFKNEIETEDAEEVPYFEYKDPIKSASPNVQFVNVDEIKIHTDYRLSPDYQKSPTSSRLRIAVSKKPSMFSFLDQTSDALKLSSNSIPNMSSSPKDIFFSVAVPGSKILSTSPIVKSIEESAKKRMSSRQNLAFFLQTINSSSRTKVALDRENAHFHLSEAIIATSQQLKMNKLLEGKYKKIPKDTFSPRRQFQHPPPPRINPKFTIGSVDDDSESSLSDEISSTATSSDELCEVVPQMEWNYADDPLSAESIAMMLMTKFKNQPLPNPKSLLWLVNESQAPQQLLPFPDSFPINPDEPFHLNTFIRGSKDWAPPRQQIIFTVHPTPDRRRQMLLQNNRCAGCGMKVARAYVHTFRYCDYLGKYFCSACHKNQISAIPARVLDKWDFSLYAVSSFSYKWLEQIWHVPLFHVGDLKPQLYEKAKPLKKAKEARLQLKFVQDFIQQCRFAEREKEYCKEIPTHWTDDICDIWSMTDFMDVKNSVFTERIQEIVKQLEQHIIKNNCEVRNF
jgi:run domain Beclin-1 interacting and cysteine-rich containing protein